MWLDREPEGLSIEDRLPASLTSVTAHVARVRRDAERAGAKAQKETRAAVNQLTSLGLSRRDAADLLGLSRQRVQQLVDAG